MVTVIVCDICGDALPALTSRAAAIVPWTVRRFGPGVVACPECCSAAKSEPDNVFSRVLPWVRTWQRRCRARHETHGRCDLAAGHDGDHALEHGMDIPQWSTEWTA